MSEERMCTHLASGKTLCADRGTPPSPIDGIILLYVAGERLVSAVRKEEQGGRLSSDSCVPDRHGWPRSIWMQQPWTNMMYTSSPANGCHQSLPHHGDRR